MLRPHGAEEAPSPSAHPFYIKSNILRSDSTKKGKAFQMKQTDEMRQKKEKILGGVNLQEEYAKRNGGSMVM